MRGRAPRLEPGCAVVMFIDDNTWEAFSALAGALRSRGIRTRRVTVPPRDLTHRAMAGLERLLYGPTWYLVRPPSFAGAPATVDVDLVLDVMGDDTVDVQAQDDLAYALLASDQTGHPAMDRTRRRDVTRLMYDKAATQELAESVGVSAPKLYDLDEIEYPVVVKARVGFGGNRVRTAHDPTELDQIRAELSRMGVRERLLQECHRGGQINIGAVALNGEVLTAVAYQMRPPEGDPLGPPATCIAVDRPDLIESATTVISALSFTGFVCIDFIVALDGRALLIDFNPPAFDSWLALQSLGAHFFGAYGAAIGSGDRPGIVNPSANLAPSNTEEDHPQSIRPDGGIPDARRSGAEQ